MGSLVAASGFLSRLSRGGRTFVLSACLLAAPVPGIAQRGPSFGENPFDGAGEAARELADGLQAVRTGLPGFAIDFLAPLSDDPRLSPGDRRRAFLGLLDAYIQRNRPSEAIRLLRRNGDGGDPAQRLRWAISEFLGGNAGRAEAWIRRVSPEDLSRRDRPWLFLLRGLIADREGAAEKASELLGKAYEAAPSPFLRDTFDAIQTRLNILRGDVDEGTVLALKRQFESAVAIPLRVRLAREYALVLMGLGRTDEAVAFLETFAEEGDADDSLLANEVLLPLAVFQGLDSPEGIATLWDILRLGTDRDNLRIALNLLLRGIDSPSAATAENLAATLEARPDHPIRDRILFAKAEVLARSGDYEGALSAVDDLLEEFPGTGVRGAARLSQAFLAWKQSPPQYRTAASRLLEILPGLPAPERPFYLRIAGDLYFENGDYSSAASAYRRAWELEESPAAAFQYTLSLLREGRVDEALDWTEANLAGEPPPEPDVMRRIDWNLARALLRADRAADALARISEVLDVPGLPADTRSNFSWLKAYVLSLLGENEKALATTDGLLAELAPDDAGSPAGPTGETRDSILAQTLLLKGEILFQTGETEEGLEVMKLLRERHPESRAAVLSYLFEARYFAGRDLTGEAQRRLVNLADRFPESDYAPVALYEAAIIAEARGTQESIAEAIRFLEELVERFPNHSLAIHARLREGDILRSLGDFRSARLVFENTANRFASHPLRYLAEIGTAETILADPEASTEELGGAAAALAKITTVPGVPPGIVLESQLKRAEAIRRTDRHDEARKALWGAVRPFLGNGGSGDDASVAFWLSRSLLELANWSEADGLPGEAERLLEMIDNLDLPGEKIARAKMRAQSSRQTP